MHPSSPACCNTTIKHGDGMGGLREGGETGGEKLQKKRCFLSWRGRGGGHGKAGVRESKGIVVVVRMCAKGGGGIMKGRGRCVRGKRKEEEAKRSIKKNWHTNLPLGGWGGVKHTHLSAPSAPPPPLLPHAPPIHCLRIRIRNTGMSPVREWGGEKSMSERVWGGGGFCLGGGGELG